VGTKLAEFIRNITEILKPLRMSLWVFWLLLFAALMRPKVRLTLIEWLRGRKEKLEAAKLAALKPDDPAVALWVLISVNVVFLAYNALDAAYLYFKATLPEGIGWTEYTHRGCAWLTLALFVSTCVIGFIFRGSLNFHASTDRLRKLAYTWSAQNAILGVGTFRRIQMYIDYSGLTHLRLTGIYGTILVCVGLVIMVVKIRDTRNFLWMIRMDVAAFLAAVTLLALTPMDRICSCYNVPRVLGGKREAIRPIFLKDLTPEALPALIPLLDYEHERDPKQTRIVREGTAALLGQHLRELDAAKDGPWTRWQGAGAWARKHLDPLRGRLEKVVPEELRDEARETAYEYAYE
jgi:hypothetical protein